MEKIPRVISLEIKENQEHNLREKLKNLGYPFADENVGIFESGGMKAKSFVSCAIGKIENFKINKKTNFRSGFLSLELKQKRKNR